MADVIEQYRVPVLEAFPWQEPVKSKSLSSPPPVVEKGDRYLIPPTVSQNSVWNGHANQIAWYDGFNWHFDTPYPGWVAYISDIDSTFRFNGDAWVSNQSDSTIENRLYYGQVFVNTNVQGTGDGSKLIPFKTIAEAIDLIIGKNDNATLPYIIHVARGYYDEVVTLENAALRHIYLLGDGSELTQIRGLSSKLNNDLLETIHINDVSFTGNVECIGESNLTHFGMNLVFNSCGLPEGCVSAFKNINNLTFTGNTRIDDDFVMGNIAVAQFASTVKISHQLTEKSFAVRVDLQENLPVIWAAETVIYLSCDLARFIDWQLHHGGRGYVRVREGAILGVKGNPFNIPTATTYEVINSTLFGDYTYDGELILDGSFVGGKLFRGTGSLDTRNQPASQIYNDSALPGDTMADALNGIGDRVTELENKANANNIVFDATLKDMLLEPSLTII